MTEPFYSRGGIQIFIGDCRDVMPMLDPESISAVVTDPPYGLVGGGKSGYDRLVRIAPYVGLPDFDKDDPDLAEQVDLSPVSLGGAPLTGAQWRWIESRVGVPIGAIDFNSGVDGGDIEVETGGESTVSSTDEILTLEGDTERGEFLGDYILDTRNTRNPSFGDMFGGSLGQYGSRSITMPIVIPLTSRGDCLVSSSLLSRGAFGRDDVRLGDNASGNPGGAPGVVAGARTELSIVLAFDGGRGAGEIITTRGAGQGDGGRAALAAKLVRTSTAASGLASEFEPVRVRVVGGSTDGADSSYFHLWVRSSACKDISNYTARGGFMSRDWDHAVPGVRFWDLAADVMKPGAHLVSFGGTRTSHRLVTAIEDAGFEIRESLLWLYGSGFPKSHNVGKAIDRMAGVEREALGVSPNWRESKRDREKFGSMEVRGKNAGLLTEPVTPEAEQWDGWGTALKPSHEPICLARKPFASTVAANVMEHGTGALNINASRTAHASPADLAESEGKNQHTNYRNPNSNRDSYSGSMPPRQDYVGASGRWPANVLLDDEAAALLDGQTGVSSSRQSLRKKAGSKTGGASRFFARLPIDGDDVTRFKYQAKASRRERNHGLDGMPLKVQRTMNDYAEGGSNRNSNKPKANHHPTCKPIALMEWLITLITPPSGVALDPFMGSGSTLVAAARLGVSAIGIEMDAEYAEIAARRIDAALDDRENAVNQQELLMRAGG